MSKSFAEEEFGSDSEDEDFIPDGKYVSASEGEGEADMSEGEGHVGVPAKRKGRHKTGSRKRVKEKGATSDSRTNNDESTASQEPTIHDSSHEDAEKRHRIDALWQEMNAKPHTEKRSVINPLAAKSTSSKTVTKSYQFAGQTFSVTEDISEIPASHTTSTPDDTSHPDSVVQPTAPSKPQSTARRKRPSNLLLLAAKYGLADAAKLTVLEKSRLDWKRHVQEQGDAHSLQQHRKDGYLEKVDFLKRTDERQADFVKHLKDTSKGGRRR